MDHLVRDSYDSWMRTLSNWDPGGLCTDVPELDWRMVLLPEGTGPASPEFDGAFDRMITGGRRARIEDAVELLTGVLTAWRFLPRHGRAASGYYAAAALLSAGAFPAVQAALVAPRWERAWRSLGAVVAEPAATLCQRLADASAASSRDAAS